jgi:hypothetical protein
MEIPMKSFKEFIEEEKPGLWANIRKKRERIKHGSGERMRKPGSEGAPTAAALKASQTEEVVINKEHKVGDTVSIDNPGHSSHKKSGKILKIVGNNARIKYGSEWHPETPVWVQHTTFVPVSTLKKHQSEEVIIERGADSKGYFRSTEAGAGLTAKGAAHFRSENPGSKLGTAVTGSPKPGSKDANRRKSFCARMSGMPGPMEDEKGRPTRKAMSLRRWKCR